jgi:ribosomal protein L37AE/L43A
MDCEHWTVIRGTDHVWRCEECELEFTPQNQAGTGPSRPAWPRGALRRE